MFTEKWPYSNFHELNLDWILGTLKKQDAAIADFISLNSITYSDPIQWDITRQYPKNCVVLDKNGNGYLSVQPVPVGVEIGNTDYWTKIGNFSELWASVKLAITAADEGLKTTASVDRAKDDLVWLNNDLYVCTTAITKGTAYGTNNTAKTTIDARLAAIRQAVNTLASNVADNTSALNNKIDKATEGDLAQTVSGAYDIHANTFAVTSNEAAGNRPAFKVYTNPNTPVDIGSDGGIYLHGLAKTNQVIRQYDDNFDYWPLSDYRGNVKKVAIISDSANFTIIPHSPVDIRKYQTLKMDGTDDITETINTHTKDEPLFIPAGTYLVSAPLQIKHSLYGAASSRDPRRGTSDTILKYTANPTTFGNLGVITVSGTDVTGNIVVANLDIICNGMIGGVVYKTNVYTDNSLYNVSVYGVKSYGVYINPTETTLNRFCYVDHVSVWGFSDNTPTERWTGNVGFYIGTKAPDCYLNNVLSMVCQTGFDIRKNTFGVNWTTFNGIPANGSGGTDANTWWDNTTGVKITNDDIHVTNMYLDTCRRGIIFDGPGKSAAYINNLIYTCEESTATTGTGNAAIALIGTSPSPQLIVNGGIINRTSKVSTTVQTIGTYPITAMMCKLDDVFIYTDRNNIFTADNNQYICKSGEHRCIDLAITNQSQYTVAGQAETGDPEQYKMFAIIPHPSGVLTSQGSIRIMDRNNVDMTVYLSNNPASGLNLWAISAVDNRALNKALNDAAAGTGKTLTYSLAANLDRLYYVDDGNAIILYCKRPASYEYTVVCEGFMQGNSPVMLDRIRNLDGTPMDYPRWSTNSGLTAIKTLRPSIS